MRTSLETSEVINYTRNECTFSVIDKRNKVEDLDVDTDSDDDGMTDVPRKVLTEKDLEEMHGGPGVYSVDLNKVLHSFRV